MSEPNSPVDSRDLELLRADESPDPALRARVRSKLTAIIPMGGGGSPGDAATAPNTEARRPSAAGSAVAYGSLGMKVLTFLAGGAAGVALYASLAKAPPQQVVYIDRPVVQPVSSAAPPLDESDAVLQTSPPAVKPVAPRSSTSRSHASQLSEERVILDEARAAISRGDTRQGFDSLERHRRLFPNALLAEERDALQVQALVKAARYDDARARADAFRKRAPGSLFLPMVDAAIASIP